MLFIYFSNPGLEIVMPWKNVNGFNCLLLFTVDIKNISGKVNLNQFNHFLVGYFVN